MFYFVFVDSMFLKAMSPAEVTEKLGLQQMRERSWYVHPRYVLSLSSSVSSIALLRLLLQLCDNWRRSLRRPSMALSERQETDSIRTPNGRPRPLISHFSITISDLISSIPVSYGTSPLLFNFSCLASFQSPMPFTRDDRCMGCFAFCFRTL